MFTPEIIELPPEQNAVLAALTDGAEINLEIEEVAEQPLFVITTL